MRHLCSNSIEISTKFIMMTQNRSLKHIGHPPSWIFRIFYRAMLWPCVDVSVGLSVCLPQIGVLLKRLNVGSNKQHRTIAQGRLQILYTSWPREVLSLS